MNKTEKLWTRSFLILWQSQLVSTVGDAVYGIALGFWVLDATGSTSLMGGLMAASTLPGILLSPFAGVLIDRTDKKRLLILMDLLRGVCIVLLAAAAYAGLLGVWMVFAAGILLSAAGAVFSPGVQSSIPDLVPPSRVGNANSVFSVVTTGSGLVGNAAGGFLYQALGAPALFLLNGVSYLFSGASLPFVKIPSVHRPERPHFFQDMADGFKYVWRQKGLRVILIVAAVINFFFSVAVLLLLPLCRADPNLGSGRYGIIMACFMGGSLAGYAALSVVTVKTQHKMALLLVTNITTNVLLITAVNQSNFLLMCVMIAVAGFTNSFINVLLATTVQVSTSPEMRGKVTSLMRMLTSGLTPVAMALGGVLGDLLPYRLVITASFALVFVSTVPSYLSKAFRDYITKDYGEGG